MKLKKLIPGYLRLRYQLLKRIFRDFRTGDAHCFAKEKFDSDSFAFSKEIIQPVGNSHLTKSKIHNLKTAAASINRIIISSGEIFSFWKIIGEPSKKNNYRKGRNLINGKLVEGYGGGLCQLSGVIYLLALKTGLEITERHNHSTDIYKEEERYTPLGSDATVVFGYKDLRLRNNFSFPVKFEIEVTDSKLICRLKSKEELQEKRTEFRRNYSGDTVEVKTFVGGEFFNISKYKLPGN